NLDAALMTDGKLDKATGVKRDSRDRATITISYDSPQTVRSLSAYLPGTADMFSGPALTMVLESSANDGTWAKVAEFKPTLAPSTIGFAPVTARSFRLRMTPIDSLSPIDLMSAPGYAGVNYASFQRSMPFQVAELKLSAEPKLDQFETKAGFGIARDYYALDAGAAAGESGIAPNAIVDLTGRLTPDGILDWKPGPGTWRVLRLGWSLTGKTNHPA